MAYNSSSSETPQSFQEHPDYIRGIAYIEAGEWKKAYQAFQALPNVYPDNPEVADLLKEAQMRATLAQAGPKQASSKKFSWLIISLLLVITLALTGYIVYSVWLGPLFSQELRLQEITNLRAKADEAIAARDYDQARQALEELQILLPDDTDILADLHQIEQVNSTAQLYDEAQALIAAYNWDQALETLTELQKLDAQYRDVPQLLETVQESQAMEREFQMAEAAFSDQDWATAIAGYSALQQTDLTFRFEDIQDRLFESYLRQGQALLEKAGTDSDQVTEALSSFDQALTLKPIDAEAAAERRKAETYLAALKSVDQAEQIKLLQTLYDEHPEYAEKEVAQLLYTLLLERATAYAEAGDQESAIVDYEAASQLLVEDTLAAQEKLAELTLNTSSEE